MPSYMTSAQLRALAIKRKRNLLESAVAGDGGAPTGRYSRYAADPVGFGTEVLGEHFTDSVVKVMESVRDNPVTIAISANATGKTHCAARLAVWFYKVYPGAQVYTTSAPPERNLFKILWGELHSVAYKHADLFAEDRVSIGMNIQKDAQSFITGVPIPMAGSDAQREAKFSGKHAPYLLFVVDEADAVPPEVFRGIESCMSGGMARLLVMFNPRSEVGTVANMIKKGEGKVIRLSAFEHPNVVSGDDVIPGAVSREKTVRRINEWTRPLAPGEAIDKECFQVPDFLVGVVAMSLANVPYQPLPAGWRKVTNTAFFYMVLGVYPPQAASQLISRAWVDAAQTRWLSYVAKYGEVPPKGMSPICGLDVADMGIDSNVLTRRYGGWVEKQSSWSGIDPDATAIKVAGSLKMLGLRNSEIEINVDATGVGAGVAPRLTRLGFGKANGIMVAASPTYDVKELGAFYQMRDQLWWTMMTWLRDDTGAMLPPDEELAQELCTPSYEIAGGKIRVSNKATMKELLGRSPDRAESLMMTFAPHTVSAGAWR